jgi:hypothetical protein
VPEKVPEKVIARMIPGHFSFHREYRRADSLMADKGRDINYQSST